MAKKNNKQPQQGGSSSQKTTTIKRCTCDHPYQCSCGNRPTRPSSGHKWDPETQQWGGKGHKQKGASGQVATVGTAVSQTSVGKTSLAQWQRLPTTLLDEFCKREKRPSPTYRKISLNPGLYQYQCVIEDSKVSKRGGDYDLVFIPASPVPNEEQAQQEAALLALLHLTPKMPHEMKLPEPYKTTWLCAIQNAVSNECATSHGTTSKTTSEKSDSCESTISSSEINTTKSTSNKTKPISDTSSLATTLSKASPMGAQVSTSLTQLTSFASTAEMRKQAEKRRIERNAMIQKHEALRLANRDHEVFMSAKVRKLIESFLRRETNGENDSLLRSLSVVVSDDEIDDDLEINDEESVDPTTYIKSYVTKRLIHEGFTPKQALVAFQSVVPSSRIQKMSLLNNSDDDKMDQTYEECLQWLCVHLDEDQLPVGFDPRGGTLEVVLPSEKKGGETKQPSFQSTSSSTVAIKVSEATLDSFVQGKNDVISGESLHDVKAIMATYGISFPVAKHLTMFASPDVALWDAFCVTLGYEKNTLNGMSLHFVTLPQEQIAQNRQESEIELEALHGIFGEECSVRRSNDTMKINNADTDIPTVRVSIPINTDEVSCTLLVQYIDGLYPCTPPLVFIKEWCGACKNVRMEDFSVSVHLAIISFSQQQSPGEPIIYSLYTVLHALCSQVEPTSKYTPQALTYGKVEEYLLKCFEKGTSNEDGCVTRKRAEKSLEKGPIVQSDESQISEPTRSNRTKQSCLIEKVPKNRNRNSFWTMPGAKFPPATVSPKVSTLIETTRAALPAAKCRSEFLCKLKATERVLLISGETGCGKTTQIPQFVLEDSPSDAKIVVTQPRRLAAIGVANRVAQERGEEKPGVKSVGYVVRGESAVSSNCRLLFCTTGVLLRQLQDDDALNCITHIIIDEVHERTLDCDILLGILKESLHRIPHLRVILMSATLDADRFALYWGKNTPRMYIPGFTYPVKDYTLEDVLTITGYIPPKHTKKKSKVHAMNSLASDIAEPNKSDYDGEDVDGEILHIGSDEVSVNDKISIQYLLERVKEDEIDYDMIATLVKHLVRSKSPDDDGSILIFLPGAAEISRAEDAIRLLTKGMPILTLQLHGAIQPKDQQRVFPKAASGITKVILATNVAETSITIPDCTIVIDTCKEKQSSYDPSNRMPLLVEQFAAKDSIRQRRGRAGRVRPGTCYKLITSQTLSRLQEHSEPEIKRCALDQILLSLFFLGVENGKGNFLSTLLDPPSKSSIDSAIFSLDKLGALVKYGVDEDFQLTPLGMHLAVIPAPPSVGKLLVMGALLGCRATSLAIAAVMTAARSPLLRIDLAPFSDRDESSTTRAVMSDILNERGKEFKLVGNSDLAFLASLYLKWQSSCEKKKFCDKLGLSIHGMKELKQLYDQLDMSLSTAGFQESETSNSNSKSWRIVRCCIVSALSPCHLVRVSRGVTKYIETVEGAVEKEGVAKDLSFFTRGAEDSSTRKYYGIAEERVFMHPSSNNFSTGNFSCPWIVYHQLVRTSKSFLRDATECSSYALLLFGGDISVQASNNLIVVDGYVRLSANARIGALIGGLRKKVDEVLTRKVENPELDVASSDEMKLIVKLLVGDGL